MPKPSYLWTDESYRVVEELASLGCTTPEICCVLACSKEDWHRQLHIEIAIHGKGKGLIQGALRRGRYNMMVSIRRKLMSQAITKGNNSALLYLARTMLGEPTNIKAPQSSVKFDTMTDAELEQLAKSALSLDKDDDGDVDDCGLESTPIGVLQHIDNSTAITIGSKH